MVLDIPLRLSIDDCDSRQFPWEWAATLAISLDGVVQDNVISYDIEAGEIVRLCVNADGKLYADPECNDRAARETVRGVVTVGYKPG